MSSEPYETQTPYGGSGGWPVEQLPGQTPGAMVTETQGSQSVAEPTQGAATSPPVTPVPAVDLIENTDEIWVFIDLPGFKPEEIQLEGDPRTLHIGATRPSEVEDGRNVLVNERFVQIDRTIQLPTDVEMDEIDAVFEDGVCKITVPKKASERYREIDIRSA
ncbi:Hsp20/alpha crystallin family protein [Halobellus rufus]|uniref:Hsp20/alpha crystallin family protein n=1 Tax=Halobellus rufus TaxID=1448860 RepID=UPI0012E04250|nr:Hsp20/alpha crystallin family protein [Halobellus rufus]